MKETKIRPIEPNMILGYGKLVQNLSKKIKERFKNFSFGFKIIFIILAVIVALAIIFLFGGIKILNMWLN